MPVVNRLPRLGEKEPVLTCVSGGWTSSRNNYAIAYNHYLNSEYWVAHSNNQGIICQKDFTALMILTQGTNTDSTTTARRVLFLDKSTGAVDLLEVAWTKFGQNSRIYKFKQGDVLSGWQENSNNASPTIGLAFIFALD